MLQIRLLLVHITNDYLWQWVECLYHDVIKVEGYCNYGEDIKVSRNSKLQIIVITCTLIALLFSSSISSTVSETYLEAETKPVGTTSIQSG